MCLSEQLLPKPTSNFCPAADAAAALAQPWIAYCDGSAVPNPGRIGLGAVVIAPDGIRHLLSMATDSRGCNDEAEARTLRVALRQLQALGSSCRFTRQQPSC